MSDDAFLKAGPHEESMIQFKGVRMDSECEPKPRYPKFWELDERGRERLERHEMGIAEAQCFRARKSAKRCGAFGKGKNVP